MYFWNIQNLRQKLIDNSLSEKSQMIYLMLTMVLYALSGQFAGSVYVEGYFLAETIAILGTTILGIIYCYDGNMSGDGKEFIKRFICVSWLVTVRLILIALIIFFIIGLLMLPFENLVNDITENKLFDIASLIILEVIFFWLIHKHLKLISINSQKLL